MQELKWYLFPAPISLSLFLSHFPHLSIFWLCSLCCLCPPTEKIATSHSRLLLYQLSKPVGTAFDPSGCRGKSQD